jgi:hypothetical protein
MRQADSSGLSDNIVTAATRAKENFVVQLRRDGPLRHRAMRHRIAVMRAAALV